MKKNNKHIKKKSTTETEAVSVGEEGADAGGGAGTAGEKAAATELATAGGEAATATA